MSDIDAWLGSLGLDRYSATFARHDIEFDILPGLTDADLEKIGVTLGHRRKLLHAIATIGATPDPARLPANHATLAPVAVAAEAQRRQVTVLFCDLVGSTDLANHIDPEELRDLIRSYQDACVGAMARFDGLLAQFLGDGVLAYFGYPRAHEDSVRQAVRAALAVVSAMEQLRRPDGLPLQVRLGLATGLVVIGDILNDVASREYAITGATPNLAARLQALAHPDQVLVSGSTRELLGAQFECESQGEHLLKGFAQPVEVWRVMREVPLESRFAAAAVGSAADLVGRATELRQLQDTWLRVRQGTGQVALLQGEAGLGKSRLVDSLSRHCEAAPYKRALWQCSPDHTNSTLFPVIRYLERAAGLGLADDAPTRFSRLGALLEGGTPEATVLIAELLSIEPKDLYTPSTASPAVHMAATIEALAAHLEHLASREPLLLVIEDAHWIDPTTQKLLTRIINGVAGIPMLVLVTARNEYAWPWPVRGAVSCCTLTRLEPAQSGELVTALAGTRQLDASVVAQILARGEGIPLFVQELTRAALTSRSGEQPVVPMTLHDSLMARLDQLGSAREIIQVAAAIGQQFPRSLLLLVASDASVDVMVGVAQLVDAGFLIPETRAREPGYRFSHALMRDIAYENLLKGLRRKIHERIAHALIEHFGEVVLTEPELVAKHFSVAGMPQQASELYERAGDRDAGKWAYAEAVAHFSASHAEARKLPSESDRLRREIDVLLKLGSALSIVHGPQAVQTSETYELTRGLAAQAGDEVALFKAIWGLWFSATNTRQLETARERAQELVALGSKTPDSDLMLEAFHCRWSTAYFRGDMATAMADSREGVRRYDVVRHGWMGDVFGGHDPGVCAHCVGAHSQAMAGFTRQARASVECGLMLAETQRQPFSLGFAMMNALILWQTLDEHDAVSTMATRLIAHASHFNFSPLLSHGYMSSGWAMAVGGDVGGGVALMEREYPKAAAAGPHFRYYAAILADVLYQAGREADALAMVDEELQSVTQARVGIYVPELHRLKGLCLARIPGGSQDAALASLHEALDTAREHGAVLLQLKAALSMATVAPSEESNAILRGVLAITPDECDALVVERCREMLRG